MAGVLTFGRYGIGLGSGFSKYYLIARSLSSFEALIERLSNELESFPRKIEFP